MFVLPPLVVQQLILLLLEEVPQLRRTVLQRLAQLRLLQLPAQRLGRVADLLQGGLDRALGLRERPADRGLRLLGLRRLGALDLLLLLLRSGLGGLVLGGSLLL